MDITADSRPKHPPHVAHVWHLEAGHQPSLEHLKRSVVAARQQHAIRIKSEEYRLVVVGSEFLLYRGRPGEDIDARFAFKGFGSGSREESVMVPCQFLRRSLRPRNNLRSFMTNTAAVASS